MRNIVELTALLSVTTQKPTKGTMGGSPKERSIPEIMTAVEAIQDLVRYKKPHTYIKFNNSGSKPNVKARDAMRTRFQGLPLYGAAQDPWDLWVDDSRPVENRWEKDTLNLAKTGTKAARKAYWAHPVIERNTLKFAYAAIRIPGKTRYLVPTIMVVHQKP